LPVDRSIDPDVAADRHGAADVGPARDCDLLQPGAAVDDEVPDLELADFLRGGKEAAELNDTEAARVRRD
jgi:hypothetical protein